MFIRETIWAVILNGYKLYLVLYY